ncbi:MAG: T9SS type A sorting domain-containing protein [Bacteroidota bacterium]
MKNLQNNISTYSFLFLVTILLSSFLTKGGTPLSGSYTIDSALPTSGTNFQSFTDFATSINSNGISSSVSISVTAGSGPYNEQVVINPITGSGPTATVTLNGNGELLTAVTSTTQRHVLRLAGVSNCSINNLHIAYDAASTGGFYGIQLLDSARNVIISDCDISIAGTTSTLYGSIVASGSETSILDPGNFHDVTIYHNTLQGGGYGVSFYGEGNNLATGINIDNNTIYDFHSNGIYLRESDGTIISNNIFDKRTAQITSTNAIQIAQAANINAQIFNNTISISQTNNGTMTIRGIYLFNGTGHRVYNNVIHDVRLTSGNFTAIEVRTAATAPEIYYNTVSLDNNVATSGDLTGFSEELSNTNSVLRNNMISISQQCSGAKTGIMLGAIATANTAISSNYNNIYVPGGNVAVKGSLTPVIYSTLALWQAASNQDANSQILNPQFTSAAVSVPTNLALDGSAIAIPSVITDITGITRGTPPDIGTYEFGVVSVNEFSSENVLPAYPNPASSVLSVELPVELSEKYLAAVYGVAGNKISDVILSGDGLKRQLSVADLSSGFYFLSIISSENKYNVRFVKE